MSAGHGRKPAEVALPSLIIADDEWEKHLKLPGLRAKWAGPTEPMTSIFKRLRTEHGDSITFLQAQTDYIEALKNFRDKSCPTFLFFFHGVLVNIIRGANGPLIEKTIKEQLDIEKSGGHHKPAAAEDGQEILVPSQTSIARSLTSLLLAKEQAKEEAAIRASQTSISNSSSNNPTSTVGHTQTFALIKPDAMKPAVVEGIMESIRAARFHVVHLKKVWMSPAVVEELYGEQHRGKPFFPSLITYFTSGPCLALVLSKENAVDEWRNLIGPANPKDAKENAPKSLRAHFGTDNRINAVFGSDSQESADREKEIFFGPNSIVQELPIIPSEMSIVDSPGVQKTLCIIKSEDVEIREAIIERIICRGIEIFKRDELALDAATAQELFPNLSQEEQDFLTKFSHLALVLKGENVVHMWSEMAGPEDPEAAKTAHPQSIRAVFGKDLIRNAVHASINAEKALHETNSLFPHLIMERGGSVVLRDSRVGTSTNPYPADHRASVAELHAKLERTVALIKPDAYSSGKKDAILERIHAAGFKIIKEQEVQLSLGQVQEFYKEHQTKPFYEELVSWISGTPIYAMVLEKEGAIGAWRELAGPTNSVKAKEFAPDSLRALYGTDGSHNAVHGSDAPISAEREIKVIFGDSVSPFPEDLTDGSEPPFRASVGPMMPPKPTPSLERSASAAKLVGGDAPVSSRSGSAANLLEKKASASGGLGGGAPAAERSSIHKSASKLASASSRTNLGSKSNLMVGGGSKADLSRTGSASKLPSSNSGSKANLLPITNATGSKANLTSSKSNLSHVAAVGSKSNLTSPGSKSGSKTNLSGSKSNLS